MAEKISFSDFLKSVDPFYHDFVEKLHSELTECGCRAEISQAKMGYVVSYKNKRKKTTLNFVFRKSGLYVRIYADGLNNYADVLKDFPESLIKKIVNSPVCKRLIDPTDCSPTCPQGFTFELDVKRHQKCRYNCFLIPVIPEYIPAITSLVEGELKSLAE